MRVLGFGRHASLVLGLAALAGPGCSVSEADPTDEPTAGTGGSTSAAAGAAPGGSPSTAGTSPTVGGGGTGPAGGAGAGAAQGGNAPTAGANAGGGGSAPTAGTAGTGGSAGGSTAGSVPIDPALRQKCTGTSPIVCKLDAADGNWDVTVDLGSDTAAGNSRVAAETRHYFGAARATAAAAHELVNFTANVRMEKHDGGQSAPSNILD